MGCNNTKFRNAELTFFVPPISGGKVISVYDGDTFTIVSELNINGIKKDYKFRVRIREIDAPEIRGVDKYNAIISRDFVNQRIMNNNVILDRVAYDKYGRILADVYYNGINLGQELLENNLAKKYGS